MIDIKEKDVVKYLNNFKSLEINIELNRKFKRNVYNT